MIESTLRLLRPAIRELKAYQSARSLGIAGSVFLDANEYPTAPVGEAQRLNRYPSPQPAALVEALAVRYGVPPSWVMVGRGSDEAIDTLVRAFCEAGRDAILICPPTYGVYEVAASIQGAEIVRVPTTEADGFAIDSERVLSAVTPAVKLVFVCTPNNPTGNRIPTDVIESLARRLSGRAVLVVDEAYVEFSSLPSFTGNLGNHPNVVVLRTLSKAGALAGARCGVAIGHPELIAVLQKVRAPYPIPAPILDSALAAARADWASRIAGIVGERERLTEALVASPLVDKVFPSEGNFLLVRAYDGEDFLRRCLQRGLVTRDRGREPGLKNCIRITVGTRAENDLLLEALS